MAHKILTGMLIAVSSILLAASIIGIGAIWIYREPLTQKSITRLEEIDSELTQAQSAIQTAKTELERTLRIVDSAEKTLASLRQQAAEAKELMEAVNTTLDDKLIPGLKTTRGKIDGLRTTMENLRNTLKEINSIPFVNLNVPGDELLVNIISGVDSLDAEIGNVQDLAQKASTFTGDTSYLLGGDLTETRQHLQGLLDTVSEYDMKVTDWHTQVKKLIDSLPGWINDAAIILTLFLLWFGFSQFGLLLHGLSLQRGGDMLAVLRRNSTPD